MTFPAETGGKFSCKHYCSAAAYAEQWASLPANMSQEAAHYWPTLTTSDKFPDGVLLPFAISTTHGMGHCKETGREVIAGIASKTASAPHFG